jgi:hypothetical protein
MVVLAKLDPRLAEELREEITRHQRSGSLPAGLGATVVGANGDALNFREGEVG